MTEWDFLILLVVFFLGVYGIGEDRPIPATLSIVLFLSWLLGFALTP